MRSGRRPMSCECFCSPVDRVDPASWHQSSGFIRPRLIIIAFAQRNGGAKFLAGGGAVARFQRELPEFEMRASVDPLAALSGNRLPQLRARLQPPQRGERGAALIVPERLFSEHARPPVVGESR